MSRLETRVVKMIDPEQFGDDERHLQAQAKCPECSTWGEIDEDQMKGAVSMICTECGWHGYIGGDSAS